MATKTQPSSHFIAWEDAVTDELSSLLDATRSDAQALLEAHADDVAEAWRCQMDAKAAAELIAAKEAP